MPFVRSQMGQKADLLKKEQTSLVSGKFMDRHKTLYYVIVCCRDF